MKWRFTKFSSTYLTAALLGDDIEDKGNEGEEDDDEPVAAVNVQGVEEVREVLLRGHITGAKINVSSSVRREATDTTTVARRIIGRAGVSATALPHEQYRQISEGVTAAEYGAIEASSGDSHSSDEYECAEEDVAAEYKYRSNGNCEYCRKCGE